MTFNPTSSIAPFLQTSVFFPEEFDEFRVKFLQLYRDISNSVNVRQIGVFDLQEFLTGESWATNGDPQRKKQTYRTIYYFSDASLNFAHNITNLTLTTHIYGSFTDGTNFYPLPYVSAVAVANQIQIVVTPTNIVVTKGGGAPAITNGVIILEYLRN